MFTIGIFTTHIPYIAFVVFYAFFLLFGVNKASSGEIQRSEKQLVIKAPSSELTNANAADSGSYHYQQGAGIFSPGTNEFFIFREKTRQARFNNENIRHCCFTQALFSRPPPVLS